MDCQKAGDLIIDAFLEQEFQAEDFINNKLISKDLYTHLKNCSGCKELVEDLSDIKKSLDETVELNTPPQGYFIHLIETKQKEKELTLKEAGLFLGVGFFILGFFYLGIQFNFIMQFIGTTSFLALLLTIYAFISEKEVRG